MRFGILGPLVVTDDEGRELTLGGPKQRSLLAILLLHAGEIVPSDRLIEELWGERASVKAAKTLHVYVSKLRKALGAGWVTTHAPGYVLSTESAELDADRFATLVAEGHQALQSGDARRALDALREGLDLWRGPPLADLTYETFAQGEIARLSEARLGALEDRIDAELALGRHGALVGELEALVREHPVRERLRGQLMLALYRSGRQADALQAYGQTRRHLSEELGLEPGLELRALQSAILNQDPALAVAVAAGEPEAPTDEPGMREVTPPPRRQRKVVTALHCDVERSAELEGQLDPEVLSGAMAHYVGEMRVVIERHGGTVAAFIGDSVMAVFGIPQVREDDALRAVRAAAELTERLPAVADEVGVHLRCRLGVSTGPVLVGTGDPLAIGDAVTVAARLARTAASGEILIGAETHRLVRDAVRVDPLEPPEPTSLSAAGGASRVMEVDRFAAGVGRHLDRPLVGRERELGWLHEAWVRSVQEPGCQLLTLLGAAGVGKSRLVAELVASLNQEALVLSGRCLPYGDGITFWPVLEALGSVAGAADQVLGRLESGTAGTPEELFLDVRRLLESLASERPVILYLDDLQWAQPTLLDLIEHLVDLSRGTPILVLCVARLELLEDRPGWAGGKLRATSLVLEPLGIDDCEALAAQLDERLGPEARRRAVAASQGNPLFLEELIALADERGTDALPPTIQALLAARIERLPLEEREVLECGAVEGEVFHRSSVGALSHTGLDSELGSGLDSLVRKELIRPYPPMVAGDEAYRFRHLLMRDVVYEGVPKGARAQLHERFACLLLEESPGELVERDEIAGWHLEQAVRYQRELGQKVDRGLLLLASDQLRAAGRRARRRADMPAATTFLERALGLAPDDDPRQGLVSAELAEQLIAVSEFDRAEALLSVAERKPEASTLTALIRLEWIVYAQTTEAPAAIRSILPGLVERLSRTGDHEGLARAHLASAALHHIQGRADDASAEALIAAQHAGKADDQGLRERALRWYAWALRWGSAPASTIAAEVERLDREEHGPYLAAEMDILRAELERYRGHFKEARDLLQRAMDPFEALGVRGAMAGHGQRVAQLEIAAGDPAAAADALMASDQFLAQRGERGQRSTVQAQLAEVHEQRGNLDAARAAIALAEELGGPDDIINFVITHGVRARLALREGQGEEAEDWARSAVKHAYMTDATDDQGQARLQLAHILGSLDRGQDAIQEARAASELFAAKGDEFGADQARALLDRLAPMSASAE